MLNASYAFTPFEQMFLSQSLHQQFNRKGWEFDSEDVAPLILRPALWIPHKADRHA